MPRVERVPPEVAAPTARVLEQAHSRLAEALATARRIGLERGELVTLIEELLARQGGRHDN